MLAIVSVRRSYIRLAIFAHQRKILTAVSVVINESGNMWSVGIDSSLFREKVFCDLVARDPDMIGAGKVDLIDGSIFLAPV
jgi:hypothetical protein